MEEAHKNPPEADQAAFAIPQKSIAAGSQSIETVSDSKDQASDEEQLGATAKAPKFRRWLTGLRRFLRWLAALPDRPWLPEVTSVLLACIAFSAIVVTLAVHQNRPLPQWPGLISINALIAIFTTIFKAALIMPVAEGIGQIKWDWFRQDRSLVDLNRVDSASRGPWGSFLLLLTNHNNYLGSFGALITIIALAVDPFSQQIILYTSCSQAVGGLMASVPVANNYSRTVYNEYNFSINGQQTADLDHQVMSALYVGIVSPPANASAAMTATCDSGNCTFSDVLNTTRASHMSLAICGECQDFTSSIKTTINENGTRHTLPPVAGYSNSSASIWLGNTTTGWSEEISLVSYEGFGYGLSDEQNFDNRIALFDAVMISNCSPVYDASGTSECSYEPLAVRCSIFPCVKTYRAEITNFVLNETELSSQPLENSNGVMLDYSDKILRDGKWSACRQSDKPISESDVPLEDSSGKITWIEQGCVWYFGADEAQGLGETLTWNGVLEAIPDSETAAGASGALWLERIYNNGKATMETVRTNIDGLANSLTAAIRQYGAANEAIKPIGTTWRNETCITVQWAWLSLPAVLLLLAIIFLVILIWKTKSRQVVLWRSSPLALLFHGLDQDVKDKYGALEEVRDMEDAARSISARVDQQTGRWHFTTQTVSKLAA